MRKLFTEGMLEIGIEIVRCEAKLDFEILVSEYRLIFAEIALTVLWVEGCDFFKTSSWLTDGDLNRFVGVRRPCSDVN